MVLDNNTALGLPEVKYLTEDSPIRSQIPKRYQKDSCIASLKSDAIGHVVRAALN